MILSHFFCIGKQFYLSGQVLSNKAFQPIYGKYDANQSKVFTQGKKIQSAQ